MRHETLCREWKVQVRRVRVSSYSYLGRSERGPCPRLAPSTRQAPRSWKARDCRSRATKRGLENTILEGSNIPKVASASGSLHRCKRCPKDIRLLRSDAFGIVSPEIGSHEAPRRGPIPSRRRRSVPAHRAFPEWFPIARRKPGWAQGSPRRLFRLLELRVSPEPAPLPSF